MRIIKNLLLILTTTFILFSCDDDICTSETESLLDAEIIVKDPALIANNYLDSLSLYSPEWSDSIHYWEEGNETILNFMLSPNDLSTIIILSSKHEALKDTIKIFHQSEMFFLSPACGFILNYELDTIINTNYLIDSILLIKNNISNDANGHIQVYL